MCGSNGTTLPFRLKRLIHISQKALFFIIDVLARYIAALCFRSVQTHVSVPRRVKIAGIDPEKAATQMSVTTVEVMAVISTESSLTRPVYLMRPRKKIN